MPEPAAVEPELHGDVLRHVVPKPHRPSTRPSRPQRALASLVGRRLAASIWPYVQVARPDHWFKNVFMLPGSLLVLNATTGFSDPALTWRIPLAMVAACLVASSYYVLNDVMDTPFDARHPVKRERPIPSGSVRLAIVYAEWVVLAAAGFGIATVIGGRFLAATTALWLMSLVYNVRPIRAKDRTYLDTLVEAVNNPLRFAMGWYATGTTLAVPVSIALAFWMLGGFFMAVKRFAEYRHFDDRERAAEYRASFRGYTEERLLVLAVFCAVAFGLFLGIFLIRYKFELLLIVPFVAGLIAWYIHLGFRSDSPTRDPEQLYRETYFMAYVVVCVLVGLLALSVDLPWLQELFRPTAILDSGGG